MTYITQQYLLASICALRSFSRECLNTIDSLVKITSEYHQIIIVTSCPKLTKYLVEKYEVKNLTIVRDRFNSGPYHAMNLGIAYLESKFVHFINEGTQINEEFNILSLYNCLSSTIILNSYKDENNQFVSRDSFYNSSFLQPNIKHESIIYPSSLIVYYGGYNIKFKISSDYDLTLRIVKNHKKNVHISSFPLVKYHDNFNFSSTLTNQWKKKLEHIKIMSEYQSKPEIMLSILKNIYLIVKIYISTVCIGALK